MTFFALRWVNCLAFDIACGTPAVSALENELSSLGESYHVASSFSTWKSYSGTKFINAGGATGSDSYTAAYSSVTAAVTGGY